ncbi:DUF2856 family protein [Salmonella enterica subsp. enterica]|nr:DUF2856 family protein [Salmonella enterica subsp. enterica]
MPAPVYGANDPRRCSNSVSGGAG